MMQQIKNIIEQHGAQLDSYITYDYGMGATKTHTYFIIGILVNSGPVKNLGKKSVQEVSRGEFVYDHALGSSTKELFSRLESFIFDLKF